MISFFTYQMMKQLFSCVFTRNNFFWLFLPFHRSLVLIQKDPLSDRYPISDGALFSNYFVTRGYHRFIYCYLFLICVIFYVNNQILSISHVVDKFRLFARTLKIGIFQYFQKITKLQLKTYAIILFASLLK